MKIAFLILLLTLSVYGQQDKKPEEKKEEKRETEPTLAETLDWLEKTLPVKATFTAHKGEVETTERVTTAEANGCKFTLDLMRQTRSSNKYSVNFINKTKYVFNLATLDIGKTKIRDAIKFEDATLIIFSLHTKNDEKLVQVEMRNSGLGNSSDTLMSQSLSVTFGEREIADRVARAFNHAIMLCQKDKKEPF